MPAARPRPCLSSRGHGFSLIELLVATALSGIVLAGAFGVLTVVLNASRVYADQYDDRVNLRVTQLTVRKALESMVAGVPLESAPVDPAAPPDGDAEEEEEQGDDETAPIESEGEALSDVVAGINAAAAGASGVQAIDPNAEPDYFQLYYEEVTEGLFVQRLEIAVREPPVPAPTRRAPVESTGFGDGGGLGLLGLFPSAPAASERPADLVRGAFRARFDDQEGYQLVWQPIAPGGEPTVLLSGVVRLEWQVLPSDLEVTEWPTAYAAYLRQDFPFAVRLIVETERGASADWVFQTNVITRGT
ncbi:MAG: prepilin-type N-terminal cleavage/methylation domain-containing protein [Planctomycetota bacterium]